MGYTVTIDEKGRIVIPKEIREKLNLKEGSKVEINLEKDGKIIISVKRLSVDNIYGIAGKESIKIEEIEESLSFEDNEWFKRIYILFSDPTYGERAKGLLKTAEEEDAYSFTLVISQVLAHLERRKKVEIIPIFMDYLKQSGIKIIETTWEDFIGATRILQSSKLSYKLWDDAIIFNQMNRFGIDVVYSNDKDFDLFPVKREF